MDEFPLDIRTLSPAEQKDRIYSLGTSHRDASEFLALIDEHGIEVAVDIRSFPTSRHAHFIQARLQSLLDSHGIQYAYLGKELGGFRKGGYLPYMETPSFQRGLERLEEMGRRKKVAFFCCERLPWRCHRRWVARRLMERGWTVIHIVEKGKVWIPKKRTN